MDYLVVFGVINLLCWRVASQMCQPIPDSQHVTLESCTYSGKRMNCSNPLIGSSAVASCQKGYRSSDKFQSSANVNCGKDGSWTNLPYCIKDCGKLGATILRPRASIISTPAMRGLFAWHVAVYKLDKKPLPICGGTIVSSHVVLSAAHCFYDEKSNNFSYNLANYEIVVAKSTRDYFTQDSEYTRSYKIREVIFADPNSFGNLGSDVAILVPEKSIEFHKGDVFPVCLEWSGQSYNNPAENTTGEVYGWGLNKYNKYSEYLVYVKIPYMSHDECLKKVTSQRITADKFCASSAESGAKLRICDRGGGLLVWNPTESRYYLKGVVSERDDGKGDTWITSFTDVSHYIHWIRDTKDRLDQVFSQSSEMDENEISVRFPTSDNSDDSSANNQCELPSRTSTLNYTIKTCESNSAVPMCRKKAGEFVPADVGLHVECADAKNKSSAFDTFCVNGQWTPLIKPCIAETSTSKPTTNPSKTPKTTKRPKGNKNSYPYTPSLIRFKEMLLEKIMIIIGMFFV